MIAIAIEPKKGYTDAQIVSYLQTFGAEHIAILAPNYISAMLDQQYFLDLEKIAHVHIKVKKQTR